MSSHELEDALKMLKTVSLSREKDIEDSINRISNNSVSTFDRTSTTGEDVKKKRVKLLNCLLGHVAKERPRDFPLPKSNDLTMQMVTETKDDILQTQKLYRRTLHKLKDIENDVEYLESKSIGLCNMREACVSRTELITVKTYEREYTVTKRLFQEVKKDLHMVVDTLFPSHPGLKELLGHLTSAYTKGGDNVYVNVTPEMLDYMNFLLEADIVTYHRNDKSRIRLAEML